jgi:hypothetical protein
MHPCSFFIQSLDSKVELEESARLMRLALNLRWFHLMSGGDEILSSERN